MSNDDISATRYEGTQSVMEMVTQEQMILEEFYEEDDVKQNVLTIPA